MIIAFIVNLQHDLNKNWKITAQVARFIYDQVGTSMWPSVVNQDGTMIRTHQHLGCKKQNDHGTGICKRRSNNRIQYVIEF